jgi:hypothetical protein
MPENLNKKENELRANEMSIFDFVGIDEKRKRVCISGHKDNFSATLINGQWIKEYPEFDDLMDNYIKMVDVERAEKFSNFARNFIDPRWADCSINSTKCKFSRSINRCYNGTPSSKTGRSRSKLRRGIQTSPNVILSERSGVRQFLSSKSPSSPSTKMFLVKLKQRGFKLNNIHNGR